MKVLAAYEAEKLLSKYVNVSKSVLAQTIDEALSFAQYPAALKIISKEALHKTEIKGVRIVHNRTDLIEQYGELLKVVRKHNIKLDGILVQKFVKGTQVFVGIKKDPTFGHVIGLGVGGILVEEIKDIEWRACPITKKDATSMLENLKFKNIIKGVRNTTNNIKELNNTLIELSHLPKSYPNLLEMDVNPLILDDKATVVDARMVFE